MSAQRIKKQRKTAADPPSMARNFSAMPPLLKLLTVVTVYSLIVSLLRIARGVPVEIEYLGKTVSPALTPLWEAGTVALGAYAVWVFFRRSYSALKTYLFINIALFAVTLLSAIYTLLRLPAADRPTATFVYALSFAVGVGLYWYLIRLRSYFNRP